MKTPASSYVAVLYTAYAVALIALVPLAYTSTDVAGRVLAIGPLIITAVMLTGRALVLRNIAAGTSAGRRNAVWLVILGVYILWALIGTAGDHALSSRQLK
jgi:hypothetical protein